MNKFEGLGLSKKLIRGIEELGIIEPTKIQEEGIPFVLNHNVDLVAQAQTGTGKTAAYGLPLLQQLNPSFSEIQVLILCPTRELCKQVAKQLFKFSKYYGKFFTEAVYGGEPMERQISALKRTTHIVVATPGRLIDLVERNALNLNYVKTVVLDEADEMLSMGFKKELDKILSFLTSAERKLLFSATLPDGIKQIIKSHFSPNAHQIVIDKRKVVNKNIRHQYVICDDVDKFQALQNFLRTVKGQTGIIFCKTKNATQKLEKQLIARNLSVGAIHGDLKQIERDKVMRGFKKGTVKYLVATDIAARGLDINNLAFVYHYQLPDKPEYYTHRSGRTARGGKDGLSISVVNTSEMKHIRFFAKTLNIHFDQIK